MTAFGNNFIYFAIASVLLWAVGAYAAWKDRKTLAYAATVAGLAVFFSYILTMWITLDRPPMRTMGETRLWYSFFLPLAGIIVYSRWNYKWLLSFSTVLSLVFICVNLLKPEIHSKPLMPALQSPWFAPHVIIYMFAYALLGAAFVMAAYLLFFNRNKTAAQKELDITDNLVYIGWAFLSLGMLTGALWAKETWAAATWLAYLTYIHYRLRKNGRIEVAMWMLIVNFALLQMCWWGINYLPSAQGMSVHTYNMQ
ncbi:cytochrome c biogenesis protein CcsA [Prevotella sp. HUN102]|uniref:cytochrome c biogenesis protein CcsA n=1 Tax=Prevotella sp. HUN102 TaxID=1392486 RepID=UPI00048EA59D|nr:cytochrome c biogenesis protein CcsA [Prevotella sp. HUN102]